jgi:hypothetical protein
MCNDLVIGVAAIVINCSKNKVNRPHKLYRPEIGLWLVHAMVHASEKRVNHGGCHLTCKTSNISLTFMIVCFYKFEGYNLLNC